MSYQQETPFVIETPVRTPVPREIIDGPITVDHVRAGKFDKPGTEQAQIRQIVTIKSHYPSATIDNNMADNPFAMEEFTALKPNIRENTETRVTWMTVPEGTSPEQVLEKLKAYPNARIYKVLSNHPILTDKQRAGMTAGLRNEAQYAESQIVKFGKDSIDEESGESREGNLILDNLGRPQYKCNFLSLDGRKDETRRSDDPEDFYAPPSIFQKMSAANQTGQRM